MGAREEQSTREVQEEPAELLEGKMKQEPICSAPLPRQSQRNDRASPSFCSSCVHGPICVSTSCLQMTREGNNMKEYAKKKSFKVEKNKTMMTEEKQNSHLNEIRGAG